MPYDALEPIAPPGVSLRAFGDAKATRKLLFENALTAAKQLPEVSHQGLTLRVKDVDYDGPEHFSYAAQKQAILSGQTLGRRLRGTFELSDATGAVKQTRRATLATIPYLTDRGMFVLNGTEYSQASQSRLLPGVFTRRKENGELSAHINVLPGQGMTHHVALDPATGVFNLEVRQAKVPLLPVLKLLGATPEQLHTTWGDVMTANQRKDDAAAVDKLALRMLRQPAASPAARAQQLKETLLATPFDPVVTGRTLGKPYTQLSLDVYLDTTRKLLAINRGEQEEDERDHLAYQRVFGPEDLIPERLTNARGVLRQLLWKASRNPRGLEALPTAPLNRAVQAAIMGSGLGQPSESINPTMVFEQQSRITRMGEGGIPSTDSIPMAARDVQPSQTGFLDLVYVPENIKTGVDLRATGAARKGSDGRLYSSFIDAKTGQRHWKSPQDLAGKTIAFRYDLQRPGETVRAIVDGRPEEVSRNAVDFVIPVAENMFNDITQLVPFKSAMKGQRSAMAGRMLTQALPIVQAEAPLVQNGVFEQPGKSYDELFGDRMGAIRAPADGVVVDVNPSGVVLRGQDGQQHTFELYTHHPNNRKTFMHQSPTVRLGQQVRAGELLARSNFTDAQGVGAIGLNARVAFLPARNAGTYEDASAVSESFAKRLASEHMYQHELEAHPQLTMNKKAFVRLYPGKLTRQQLELYDDDGVIKPGSRIEPDQPLILATREQPHMFNLLRRRKTSHADASERWEHHYAGEVTDVQKTPKGVVVAVKSTHPTEVADKLSGRHGNKGVIGQVIPDDEMPRDKEGRPVEVLMNPLGVITRGNPAQVFELLLGKIAAKTGQPYRVPDFDAIDDLREFVARELRQHGLADKEDLIDGKTGRRIKNILTGNMYLMKLHHTAASKGQGRGMSGYTSEGKPARGGVTGAKRISMQDQHALLSHGATEVMRDAIVNRGQAHFDFWRQFMGGHNAHADLPLVNQKFLDSFKAAGINVVREGPRVNFLALTDADVDELSGGRELQNADTVDWKEGLKPRKGGLFDPGMSGGHGGHKWTFFRLAEPLPSPVFEEPIRRLLGMTKQQFLDTLAGRAEYRGRSGPGAIAHALQNMNVDKELEICRQQLKSGKKTQRDVAVRRMGYLKASQATGVHPGQWVLSKVPVLPPIFRPVSAMQGSGLPIVADANYLYKDLFEANQTLQKLRTRVDDIGDERVAVYQAFKALTGLGDPINAKTAEKQVQGILAKIFGRSPKYGVVQRSLLSSPTDLVGRATVIPDSNLTMDEVGLPETKAWELYQPFIVRRLVRRGLPQTQAAQMIKERKPLARQMMLEEMQQRPVIINRAPVLHRYGVMAFWPKLTSGDALRTNPMINAGFGLDHDGDAMNYHVPFSPAAVEDALEKMLPSRNLLSAGHFKVHQTPGKEFLAGLYSASTGRAEHKPPRTFVTRQDAIRAYQRGDIDADHPVEILQDKD